nr:hypothetical protein [Methylocapsa sp. RX1]
MLFPEHLSHDAAVGDSLSACDGYESFGRKDRFLIAARLFVVTFHVSPM